MSRLRSYSLRSLISWPKDLPFIASLCRSPRHRAAVHCRPPFAGLREQGTLRVRTREMLVALEQHPGVPVRLQLPAVAA